MKKTLLALAAGLLLSAPGAMAKDADCSQCATTCDSAAKASSKKGTKYTSVVQDCSKICKLSAEMHGSQFEKQVAALCADACNKCAAACEELKDKSLQSCIDQCRKCETSCKKVAG